jgi:hypothetical protein
MSGCGRTQQLLSVRFPWAPGNDYASVISSGPFRPESGPERSVVDDGPVTSSLVLVFVQASDGAKVDHAANRTVVGESPIGPARVATNTCTNSNSPNVAVRVFALP